MVKSVPAPTRDAAMRTLSQIKDPEVPVLNIVEMGIIRDVEIGQERTRVRITPTYSGCPAMEVIERQVEAALTRAGFPKVELTRVYSPPWTTDWMTPQARRKLRDYGIAPPPSPADRLVTLDIDGRPPTCPHCGSEETEVRSLFGATACKSMNFCRRCKQPFEHFKGF